VKVVSPFVQFAVYDRGDATRSIAAGSGPVRSVRTVVPRRKIRR
jgi:hypothetical protein